MTRELPTAKQDRVDELVARTTALLANEADPMVRMQAIRMAHTKIATDSELARIMRRYGAKT